MDSNQLMEERGRLNAEARKILEAAERENRSLSAEENDKWERIMNDADSLAEKANLAAKREKTNLVEAELNRSFRKTAPAPGQQYSNRSEGNRSEALRSWFSRGASRAVSAAQIDNAAACGIDLSSRSFSVSLRSNHEQRAIANSGALNVPDFGQELDVALKMWGGAKNLVKVVPSSNGVPYPIPTLNDTANMAGIIAEGATVTAPTDPSFNSVVLNAFKYSSGPIPVSIEALQDSIIPLEQEISGLVGERIGKVINKHITVGTGTNQPYGLCSRAADSGVVVGGSVASPTFSIDLAYDLLASIDPAYRNSPGFGFMMNDSIKWRFAKLKDSTGQYLLQPSVIAGQPDRLGGFPIYVNQDMPSMAAGAKIILAGDFKRYTWREVLDVQFFRLDELYALSGQVAFLAIYRGDGNLINTSAVKYMAAPAS